MPEINSNKIKRSKIIGNPGCFATACILSSFPLKEQIESVVFDCISGYSGGGKKAQEKYDFKENIITYNLTNHFHKSEIKHYLNKNISFTPHVVNTYKGICCTTHIKLKSEINISEIKNKYENFYKNSFTKIVDYIPSTKEVVNTPFCKIGGFKKDENGIVIISVIDNLMKGASSQAVENMNILFGLKFNEGLN